MPDDLYDEFTKLANEIRDPERKRALRRSLPAESFRIRRDADISLGHVERDDYGFWEPFVSFWYNTEKGFINSLHDVGIAANKLGMGAGMQEYFEEVLNTNHQWDDPSSQNWIDKGAGGCGRILGQGWFLTFPLLLTAVYCLAKKKIFPALNAKKRSRDVSGNIPQK